MTPNEVVAHNVSELRRRYGMTQRELVDAMAERAGVKMDPATMARLEGGGRRITVEDVFSLAVALEVAPLDLLLPREPSGEVEVGTVRAGFREVRAWLRRVAPLPGADRARFHDVELPDMRLAQLTAEADGRMMMSKTLLDVALAGKDAAEVDRARRFLADALQEFDDVQAERNETGW